MPLVENVACRVVGGVDTEPNRDRLAGCIGHLGGHGTLPDQFVDPEVLGAQLTGNLFGGVEPIARRSDGFVGLLSVLRLPLVHPGLVGKELRAVAIRDLAPGGVQRLLRQRGAVGSHVGDVAALVEALGHRMALAEDNRSLRPASC